jgi:hypothetical protein
MVMALRGEVGYVRRHQEYGDQNRRSIRMLR